VCYSPGGIDQNAKTPTVEEWNLGVEREVAPNMSLRLSYVGSHGYHMLMASDPNTIVPEICASAAGCVSGSVGTARGMAALGTQYIPVGALPNPFLGAVTGTNYLGSSGFSTYNALNVSFTRRLSSGLQFKANYAWAKSEDIVAGYGCRWRGRCASELLAPKANGLRGFWYQLERSAGS